MKPSLPISLACWLIVILCCVPVQAAEKGVKITEMAVTTKIVRGNPIDSVRRISATSVKALYCFTRLTAPAGTDTVIRHAWYRNDEKTGEYELPVRGEKWRTYSKKSIDRESAGDWRVDVHDSGGNLLKSIKFRIN